MKTKRMALEKQWMTELERALLHRDIQTGFRLLDAKFPAVGLVEQRTLASVPLLCLAQWADLGYRNAPWMAAVVKQAKAFNRARISVVEYLQLRVLLKATLRWRPSNH